MNYCKHCGSQIDEGVAFCTVCGQPQSASAAAQQAPQQAPQYVAPQAPQYAPPQYVAPQAPQYAPPQYVAPQYPPQYSVPVQSAEGDDSVPGKGLGIPAMIMGIFALVFVIFWFTGEAGFVAISFFFSVAGIILGAIGKSKANSVGKTNGMANAGLVCSIITLSIFTFFLIIGLAVGF